MSSSNCTDSANATRPLPADDLCRVVEQVGDAWERLRGRSVLITGVDGFVGSWMQQSVRLVKADTLVEGWGRIHDAAKAWPNVRPDYIIHATTDGVGWRHVAEVARAAGARMLLLSSGATYGAPPNNRELIRNDGYFMVPDHTTEYGKEKRRQEVGCRDVAVIARLFTFIGPGLRRHTGREFLESDPITVNDDGAVRSYLYASDMAAACWLVLLRGQVGRAYNIGSSTPTNIADFARMCAHKRRVEISKVAASGGTYYVPDTSRIESELGFSQTIRLDAAIERTLAWACS